MSALSGFVHPMTQPPSAPAIEPGLEDVLRRLDAIEQRLSDERYSACKRKRVAPYGSDVPRA